MKKKSTLLIIISLVFSTLFARNFFDERYFEYKITVPFAFSNNCFALDDLMKEEAVIDLNSLATGVAEDGLTFLMTMNPEIQLNLNLPSVKVGLIAGLDAYANIGMGDGLLKMLGSGLKVGDELDISISPKIDLFAYAETNVGLKFNRFSFYVRPGVFAPILSVSGKGGLFVENKSDSIEMTMDAVFNLYTPFAFDNLEDFDSSSVMKGLGVDIAMGFSLPLFKHLTFSADTRMPIVPATLDYHASMEMKGGTTISLEDLDNFAFDSSDPELVSESGAKFKINRPLTLMGYVDFLPMRNLLDLRAGAGFGIFHPFMTDDSMQFYWQYYLGLTVNFINMLKFSISTEYTRQVFINQLGVVLNLRLLEIDAGVSMQSVSFTKSWLGSGFGAYLVFAMGF